MTGEAPRTIELLAQIPRGPKSRLTVALDEAANGARYISIKRWLLGKQGEWTAPRGISVQRGEIRTVAWALLRAADELDRGGPA